MYTIESRLSYSFPYEYNAPVENNIWQLWKYKSDDRRFPKECFTHIERWRFVNDNSNHNLISIQEVKEQVYDYFINDVPEVVEALELLPDDRLKYEFLKYLVIYINGGVYADVDTICAKPLKYWYDSNIVPGKLFLGVAVDYNDENWELLSNRRMAFSNKIFKAKSHHPFLAKLIARLVYMTFNQYQQITQIDWNKSFENLDSNGEPLVQFTGESILTDTLFEYLNGLDSPIVYRVARTEKDVLPQEIIGPETTDRFSYKLFTMAKGPTQVDDVVIMPEVTFKGSPEISHDLKGVEHEYDDNNQRKGYLSFYCARPLNLISWQSIEAGIVE
ncbi:unnamed protein product [Ambrosiozyma monospora]|uniref:Unnamed protein product n=1 Tax=Ambrosiozyma monospora TaxID=43982 RepID=A0A9W6WJF1_AMBMO|nr:unnamed protein product [Ambrosiozyma monospora]